MQELSLQMLQPPPLIPRIVSPDMPDHREEKLPVNYGDLFMQLTGRDFKEELALSYPFGESSVLTYSTNHAQRLNKQVCLLKTWYLVLGRYFIEVVNKATEFPVII